MLASAVGAALLIFTVPSTNAYVEGDSIFYCEGGAPTQDLAWVRFIRQDVIGGQPYVFDSLDVHGMESQSDTFAVDPGPGAHFYTVAVDDSGNPSCWSAGVYIPGYVTGVDPGPIWRKPVSVRLFDIQGRQATGYLPSGVYWRVEEYTDKEKRITKVVVLR